MADDKNAPLIALKDAVLHYRHQTAFGVTEDTVLDAAGTEIAIGPGELVGIHAGGLGSSRYYHELAVWLQGLKPAFSGSLTLFGQEPPLPPALMAKTARVFREGGLLPDFTVAGNIELGLAFSGLTRREVRERVEEALGRFDLIARRDEYPGTDAVGLETEKRLNYARAWARRPLILCIDQPFLHIRDSYAAQTVGAVNELLAAGSAVVFTTNHEHDLQPDAGGLTGWKPTRSYSLMWGRLEDLSHFADRIAAGGEIVSED